VTVQQAQPLPECIHDGCGAPLARATAIRQESLCSRHLPLYPDSWQRTRDRARLEVLHRQAEAIRARQAGRRRR
jgi:hypothetical protein